VAPVSLDLHRALKDLRQMFEAHVRPSIRRHAAARSSGQRRRDKRRRARARDARAAAKAPGGEA
jgi:hypothetical protein